MWKRPKIRSEVAQLLNEDWDFALKGRTIFFLKRKEKEKNNIDCKRKLEVQPSGFYSFVYLSSCNGEPYKKDTNEPKIVSEPHGPHVLWTEPTKQKQKRPCKEYRCGAGQIPSEG